MFKSPFCLSTRAGERHGLTSMSHSSNNTSDPRHPSAAKTFRAPTVSPKDFPYKLSSWLTFIFSVQSLANMRNIETDLKQISMAVMFAIMGLVTNYFGPAQPAAQK